MYERFPDAVEVLGSHGRGGSLRVGAMGFESGGRYGMTSVNVRATGGGVGEGLNPLPAKVLKKSRMGIAP